MIRFAVTHDVLQLQRFPKGAGCADDYQSEGRKYEGQNFAIMRHSKLLLPNRAGTGDANCIHYYHPQVRRTSGDAILAQQNRKRIP